jgi:hypothetical protein
MRIYFDSMTLPKKAAKRVKKHFTTDGQHLSKPMKLHEAQALTAKMFGYRDWYELNITTASLVHFPSIVDEKAPSDVVKRRIAYQAQVLGTILPLTKKPLIQIALKLRTALGEGNGMVNRPNHLIEHCEYSIDHNNPYSPLIKIDTNISIETIRLLAGECTEMFADDDTDYLATVFAGGLKENPVLSPLFASFTSE